MEFAKKYVLLDPRQFEELVNRDTRRDSVPEDVEAKLYQQRRTEKDRD